ncbi:MAG: acetylxylan esterase [Phycisphaerales bacterium]|nr:MAG: acetylxylan esterase [Phycisphaerales bacterium]
MIVGIYDLRSTERRKITSSVSSQWCFLGVLTGLVIGLSGLTYGADWDFQYEVVWPDLGDTTNDIAVADINSDAWPDVMGKNWSQTDPIQIWCSMLSSMGKAAVDNEIRHSGLSAEKARRWRSAIRAALFIPNPLPQLAVENHGRFEPAEGIVAERVSYATQFAMRVPAIVYSPQERRRDLPALIIVNGHGGDKYSWYAFYSGVLYARAGAVVLTYDPIGEGERNSQRKSGTRAHDTRQEPRQMGQRLGGLMVTDLMQAISCLSQRDDVDPERIAACGYSMGSFILAVTGAIDERLHACVLVGGGNLDGPDGYWDNSKPMCQGIPYQSLAFLGDRPAAIYALHAMRGPTLVFNGLEDMVVAIPTHGKSFFDDLQDRVAQLLGTREGILETGFAADVSHRPFFVTEPVALWLERQLDFPLWTPETIRTMPTTHISEWVKAENVAVDLRYASEDREGGLRALGAGVPGLSRSQLSVFTEEQWERQKGRLVYETWVREAKSRIKESPARFGDRP